MAAVSPLAPGDLLVLCLPSLLIMELEQSSQEQAVGPGKDNDVIKVVLKFVDLSGPKQ